MKMIRNENIGEKIDIGVASIEKKFQERDTFEIVWTCIQVTNKEPQLGDIRL